MTDDDIKQVQKTLKFQLSQYLKAKEANTLDVLKMLKENKQIWDEMYSPCPNHDQIKTSDYVKMQEELMILLTDSYRLD